MLYIGIHMVIYRVFQSHEAYNFFGEFLQQYTWGNAVPVWRELIQLLSLWATFMLHPNCCSVRRDGIPLGMARSSQCSHWELPLRSVSTNDVPRLSERSGNTCWCVVLHARMGVSMKNRFYKGRVSNILKVVKVFQSQNCHYING